MIFRILVLIAGVVLYFVAPQTFDVLEGWKFFTTLSPFHVLWVLWMIDMIKQLIPFKSKIARGSLKVFANQYVPAKKEQAPELLKKYIKENNKRALMILALWWLANGTIGILYAVNVIPVEWMLLLTLAYYVCDLICVLIWCPFRMMIKTRCCTTCRIFNWDHMMMFSPMFFVGGFFPASLVVMCLACFIKWEWTILRHPERFWERTNNALLCGDMCTDRLCNKKQKVAGK